jgi:hypothetical protein
VGRLRSSRTRFSARWQHTRTSWRGPAARRDRGCRWAPHAAIARRLAAHARRPPLASGGRRSPRAPPTAPPPGISRDSLHKRRATGGRQKAWRKKKKYELGRQPANTKLSSNVAVRTVRTRGGNTKFRALRLDQGNYSWGSEVGRGWEARGGWGRGSGAAGGGAPPAAAARRPQRRSAPHTGLVGTGRLWLRLR